MEKDFKKKDAELSEDEKAAAAEKAILDEQDAERVRFEAEAKVSSEQRELAVKAKSAKVAAAEKALAAAKAELVPPVKKLLPKAGHVMVMPKVNMTYAPAESMVVGEPHNILQKHFDRLSKDPRQAEKKKLFDLIK